MNSLNRDGWWDIKKEFESKFVKGHGPISCGDNYPQDAEAWVEADIDELEGWIYSKVEEAKAEERTRCLDDLDKWALELRTKIDQAISAITNH